MNAWTVARERASHTEGVHVFPSRDIHPHIVDDFDPLENPCFCFFTIEWVTGVDGRARPVVIHCRMNN